MFRVTKWLVVPMMAVGLFFAADAPSAKADGFSISIGSGRGSYGYSSYRPSYGYGSGYGYGVGYGYAPRPVVVPVVPAPYCPSGNPYYRSGYGGYTSPGYYGHRSQYPGHYGHHHQHGHSLYGY